MRFSLQPRPPGWVHEAPARVVHRFELSAAPDEVVAVLADIGGWGRWFRGMRRVEVLGKGRRDVWVGATGVRERFDVSDRGVDIAMEASNVPGLRSMAEEWRVEPAPGGSTLTVTVGAEGAGPLRWAPALVRAVIARSTAGAAGISSCWPGPSGGPTPAGG